MFPELEDTTLVVTTIRARAEFELEAFRALRREKFETRKGWWIWRSEQKAESFVDLEQSSALDPKCLKNMFLEFLGARGLQFPSLP